MAVRSWAAVDHYAVLGVARDADDDEIGRAYRSLAKQLHPDVSVTGAPTAEGDRFASIALAYEVLSDPLRRYEYDDALDSHIARTQPQRPRNVRVPSAPAAPLIRWTPRRANLAVALGIACFAAGIAMSSFILALKHGEADDRSGRVAVQAVASGTRNASGDRLVSFHTASGAAIVIPAPRRVNPGVLKPGSTLRLLYDPTNPRDVLVDETHFGRDFTLWFVAVKLIVCGPIIAVVGLRRRRRFAVALA